MFESLRRGLCLLWAWIIAAWRKVVSEGVRVLQSSLLCGAPGCLALGRTAAGVQDVFPGVHLPVTYSRPFRHAAPARRLRPSRPGAHDDAPGPSIVTTQPP